MIIVKAERINCLTDEKSIIELTVDRRQIESLDNSWWIWIVKGGVTGYESMMEDNIINKTGKLQWLACAGTKGRWDTLLLPEDSMKRIYEWIIEQRRNEN